MMGRTVPSIIQHNPIFIASSALGMFPFRFINGILELDRLLFCYSLMVATLFMLIGLFTVKEANNLSDPNDSLDLSLMHFIIFYHLLQYPGCLGIIFLKRKLLQNTVSSLQALILIFNKMKVKISSSQRVVFIDMLQPVVSFIIFYIAGNMDWAPFYWILFCAMLLTGSSLYISQFCFLVGIVSELYKAEINVLRKSELAVYRKLDFKMMEQLIQIASQIALVARNINNIYSFQLLFLISSRFLFLIIHMYDIISYVTYNYSLYYRIIIGELLMLSYHFYNSWKISHASETVSKKSKEFNTLLYQLMIDDTTNEILHNDKLRLHISMKREVVFTACGFFNLDYTLVHSMIASATTYLVILIQFGQSGSAAPESLPTVITNLTTTPLPLSLTTYQ
ncbi:Gustatory receptor 43e [Halyomorpha halys]|nr:Gustatory receptor 43e [Halyomorpha halys]